MANMRTYVMLAVVFAVFDGQQVAGLKQGTRAIANPIRKVVTMLSAMQKKVEQEGIDEKRLFDKFLCYCKNGDKDLGASIASANDKLSTLPSEIEAANGKLAQLKDDVKQHQEDRRAAKRALAEAKGIRAKEAKAFAAEKNELDTTISSVKKAVTAIEQGVSGGFLQTTAAQVLRKSLEKVDLQDADRSDLASFLSLKQESDYAPKSGEILGILKQMGDAAAANRAEVIANEDEAIKSYEQMVSARTEEVDALGLSIEEKMKRIGELGVDLVEMKADLDDSSNALAADKEFLANLEKNCKIKMKEFQERSELRATELVALADTIKLLNDDNALDLFKKTLPSAGASSFMQMMETTQSMRSRALKMVRRARRKADRHHRPKWDFLVLALAGKRSMSHGVFDKVVGICDGMIKELKKEQQADDDKKEYCAAQLRIAKGKKKGLERTLKDEEAEIGKAKDAIAALGEEIAAFEAGIIDLDQSVSSATRQRKDENEEFKSVMSANSKAKDLLVLAQKRLSQFYNPSLIEVSAASQDPVGASKTESTGHADAQVAIDQEEDENVESTADDEDEETSEAMFAQVAAHAKRVDGAPPPPPETRDAYAKKSEEASGVLQLIGVLINDLEKDMASAKADEKNNQADYETMMRESATKRTEDSKALSGKAEAKADLEKALADHTQKKKDTKSEFMATEQFLMSLKNECDFLIQTYDMRRKARRGEIDALFKAKEVLNGADSL